MRRLKIKFGPENKIQLFTESGEEISNVTSLELSVTAGQLPVAFFSVIDPEIEGEVEAAGFGGDMLADEEEFKSETVNY